MAYYTEEQLKLMNFKKIGKSVMISTLACIYNPEMVELDDYCRIDDFCVLTGKVVLGKHVHLALYTHIGGTKHGVYMEDHSECAYRCTIITHSSDYTLETLHSPSVPLDLKGGREGAVHIGRYSLLGYSTLVMPNVRIKDGCSFGAFSFVNKSTEAWGLYEGKPAVRIRENSKGCIELEKELNSRGLSQ